MQVVCDQCGTENRESAKFCKGCAAKLPSFAATGPSALQSMKALRTPHAPPSPDAPTPGLLPIETRAFWIRFAVLSVVITTAFVSWYAYVTRKVPNPASAGSVVAAPGIAGGTAECCTSPPGARGPRAARAAFATGAPHGGAGPCREPSSRPAPRKANWCRCRRRATATTPARCARTSPARSSRARARPTRGPVVRISTSLQRRAARRRSAPRPSTTSTRIAARCARRRSATWRGAIRCSWVTRARPPALPYWRARAR